MTLETAGSIGSPLPTFGPVSRGSHILRYVGGERNGPPEDCGGISGFYEWLTALADPKHEGHAEAKEWADEYDPDAVDELPIKYALSRIANRRNAARVRIAKNS